MLPAAMTRRSAKEAEVASFFEGTAAPKAAGDANAGAPVWLPAAPGARKVSARNVRKSKPNGHAPADSAGIRAEAELTASADRIDPWNRLTDEEREAIVVDAAGWRARLVDSLHAAGYDSPEDYLAAVAGLERDRAARTPARAIHVTERHAEERPWPRPRSEADAAAAMVDDWEIDSLLRRRRLLVVAGPEGLGKSHARIELGIRKATGHGALFNHYRIPRPGRVLSIDVENGEEEEVRREEETLARLGLTRADLADYWGVSLEGLSLTDPLDQAYIRASIERVEPAVVMFDTGSSMLGDEWGKELKAAIRFLRGLARQYGCAIIVFVHLVKPARVAGGAKARGKPEPNAQHGTALADVMGQWTRQADTVALMADAGAQRVLWTVRKRAPHAQLVLRAEGGTFDVVQVVAGEDLGVSTMEKIHGCIATGYADAGAIATYLELSERTVWRQIAKLRETGRVEPDMPLRVSGAVSVPVSPPVSGPASVGGASASGVDTVMSVDRADSVTPPVGGDVVSVSVEAVSVGDEGVGIFDGGDEDRVEGMPDDVAAIAAQGLVEPGWAS